MARKALVLAVLMPLAGCGRSGKTLVLTLDAVPPKAAAIRTDYSGPPIIVPAVHVPPALDRVEYVSEPSAGELRVDDFAHWGAPLGLLIRDTLTRDLIARLPAGRIVPAGLTADRKASRVLDVSIVALSITPGAATLQVAYRLLPAGPIRHVTISAAGADKPAESARTLGILVGLLADEMASKLG